jgi:hypothetical protein
VAVRVWGRRTGAGRESWVDCAVGDGCWGIGFGSLFSGKATARYVFPWWAFLVGNRIVAVRHRAA